MWGMEAGQGPEASISCAVLRLTPMAKKRKKKTFDVVKAVKSASRAAIGIVPPTKRVEVSPKKRGKVEKRKLTLGELLGEE
jgi:hypothetical protein